MTRASTSIFWTSRIGWRCITTARAVKRLVRDVSRFYSSSHDRFTYGSSFINFNLPQFYQIVQLDGRTQVIPFRSNVLSSLCVTVADGAAQPLKQQFQLH